MSVQDNNSDRFFVFSGVTGDADPQGDAEKVDSAYYSAGDEDRGEDEDLDNSENRGEDQDQDGSEDSYSSCDCDHEHIHETNHHDEWKLVMGTSVYKNNESVEVPDNQRGSMEPRKHSSFNTFFLNQLTLVRAIGYRGEVECTVGPHEYVDLPQPKYEAEFKEHRQQWQSSLEKKALAPFLKAMSVGKVPITNIVCICLGSLQTACDEPYKNRKRSHIQFAVLLTIKAIIENLNGGKKMECVAQDPDFTNFDKNFIASYGIKVVNDPRAFGAINEGTLVFQLGSYAELDYVISRGPHPAAFIKEKHIRASVPSILLHRQEARKGKMNGKQRTRMYEEDSIADMMKGCEEMEYPNDDGYASQAMVGAYVYWRRA